MTDEDFAARLKAIAAQCRDSVGDHLKLIRFADSLDEEAAGILTPPVEPEPEAKPKASKPKGGK